MTATGYKKQKIEFIKYPQLSKAGGLFCLGVRLYISQRMLQWSLVARGLILFGKC
jgi:hypothetical protein